MRLLPKSLYIVISSMIASTRLCFFVFFFNIKKKKLMINGVVCQAWRNVRGVFWSYDVMKRNGRGWVDQKRVILAWCNSWTAPLRTMHEFPCASSLLRCFKDFEKMTGFLKSFCPYVSMFAYSFQSFTKCYPCIIT